jgi:cell wall-associated NlpC family hydrolase
MRRRHLLPLALVALLAATPSSAARRSWALPEIKLVVERGVMGVTDLANFHPDDPLTAGALAQLVAGLTAQPPVPSATPAAPVTIAGLDARLVRALGLADAVTAFAQNARAAGLAPPSRFGTEAVARLLGLRTNHPAAQDELELLPSETATRAEAAYSAARILGFGGSEADSVRAAADTFVLPVLTPWQRRILQTAISFVGYPYVWGGESELPESPFGHQAHGGFDCSGFVWRVYKLQRYAGGGGLPDVLRGRTTYAMSGEVDAAKRISLAKLQPADVVFFGAKGPKSKPAEVDHMGIYLGNGWIVHSSGYGVAVAQLAGWYKTRLAWGRRPLAEAGLVSPP